VASCVVCPAGRGGPGQPGTEQVTRRGSGLMSTRQARRAPDRAVCGPTRFTIPVLALLVFGAGSGDGPLGRGGAAHTLVQISALSGESGKQEK